MPATKKKKKTKQSSAIAEHERLKAEALELVDAATDAFVVAGATYDRAVAEAKSEGVPRPQTIDEISLRVRRGFTRVARTDVGMAERDKARGKSERTGASARRGDIIVRLDEPDPLQPLRNFAAVKHTRF